MTIPAVILCGGRATRLAMLYRDRPKALVPVAHRPFLEWQLAWLAHAGICRAHLAAGYLAEQLAMWIRETKSKGQGTNQSAIANMDLSLSIEPRPLGTGGGLRYAAEFVDSDMLWVINGDTLLPTLNFQEMEMALAEMPNARMAIAVTHAANAARFGTVIVRNRRVVEFREKGRADAGWINGGVYLLHRKALALPPANVPLSIETDLFPTWARDGHIAAATAAPPLLDMGTPDGLADMERWLVANRLL